MKLNFNFDLDSSLLNSLNRIKNIKPREIPIHAEIVAKETQIGQCKNPIINFPI